jgi:OOP family OmpA-OmpF porin
MESSLRNDGYLRKLLLAVSLLSPGVVLSADNGFYLGASSADVSADFEPGFGGFAHGPEDDASGFKVIAGLRPLDSLAIEANYVDLGETQAPLSVVCITTPCPSEVSFDAKALSVSAVGLLSLPFVDLFARAGVARWESSRQIFSTAQKEEGTDPTYGVGAQVRLGSFALRLEFERFELADDSADSVSLGFTYTFL